MRRMICVTAGLWLALAGAVSAQTEPRTEARTGVNGAGPVVVELYTSQGCSSCPPADAIFEELAQRDDVIALSLHVDYWDYIGWKDSFAHPAHTERQRAYARKAGARSIYTPQMIIGGQDHMIGARSAQLTDMIRAHGAKRQPVILSLSRAGSQLRVVAEAVAPLGRHVDVQLVRYLPERDVSIKRGENAGRVITYVNIVSGWEKIAEWDGTGTLSVVVTLRGDAPVAVLLQEPGPGEIVAAASLR